MEPTNGKLTPDRWAVFERSRRRLFGIASRMLGSADDAEDLVQETSLRWLQVDAAAIRAPEGWLVAVITRLAIDHLRRAVKERQASSDAGLLGAVATSEWTAPDRPTDLTSRLSMAFLMLRERLEPAERIAFVLREVFDCDYDEVARVLDKSEAACRQIVHRARERLRQDRSRFVVQRDGTDALAERFLTALSTGDREAVLALLTEAAADGPRRSRRTASLPAGRRDRLRPWRRSPSLASSEPSWRSGVTTASPAA